MNMWIGIAPTEMCRQHLLGLHGELHKFLPSWEKKVAIDGRIADNQMECETYKQRHDEVAEEMVRRGFNHKSPLDQPDFSYLPLTHQQFRVRAAGAMSNREKLATRCAECARLMQKTLDAKHATR